MNWHFPKLECPGNRGGQCVGFITLPLTPILQCEEPVHGSGKNIAVTVLEARTNTCIPNGFESPANPSV